MSPRDGCFNHQQHSMGRNGLGLLLRAVAEQEGQDDVCRQQLEALAKEVESTMVHLERRFPPANLNDPREEPRSFAPTSTGKHAPNTAVTFFQNLFRRNAAP